jgi:hypothetical protein
MRRVCVTVMWWRLGRSVTRCKHLVVAGVFEKVNNNREDSLKDMTIVEVV